jgi:hypothetical protein
MKLIQRLRAALRLTSPAERIALQKRRMETALRAQGLSKAAAVAEVHRRFAKGAR